LVDLPHTRITYFKTRCFSAWLKFEEYHLVNLERPCRLIKKKQWIILYLNIQ
jgi:hypothetical protein